ncbi:MAG: Gfo/Idh/MocA family oxidoreductase [Candidatus Omnitrophica bacterium]|nr:Gfo/Idh/MocA family oxidoreductase [Candidatus Omnitrophota bacterium]
MKKVNRRDFAKWALGSSMMLAAPHSRALGANDDIRVAVVGFHGQGRSHINNYRSIPGVRIAALCDVDRDVLSQGLEQSKKRKESVDVYTDVRKLLEDPNIDAISTATPNHWHALITVWSCQAGKHVCVEKPVSHNIFEGRKMVEAARRYNRLVQADLDLRSDESVARAVEYIQQGRLGKILYARIFNYKRRDSIGKVGGPQPIPSSIDYDLWTGPAPMTPLMRRNLHYDWHWVWPTGCGEIGNNGPHQLDICRWALGQMELPQRVFSLGGRFGYIDDGQTPNTHIAVLDYQPAPIYYESRGLPGKSGDSLMDNVQIKSVTGKPIPDQHNSKSPNMTWVIQCENGYLKYTTAYDNDGKVIRQFEGVDRGPQTSFINALRSGKQFDLRSDILEGHLSTSLSHMGNISYRVGKENSSDEIRERIQGDKVLSESYGRFLDHLAANGVDCRKTPPTLGAWLTMDPQTERFTGDLSERANQLVSRDYRAPFIVPEKV